MRAFFPLYGSDYRQSAGAAMCVVRLDTLERIFSNLESNDIHIKRARMDCGSCSREIVETIEKHFYIRANRSGSL